MQGRIIWMISGLVLAAAVAGFFLMYEQVEEEIWIGASADAKRNPFLAAQRFLAQRGVTVVETTNDLSFATLPADATVILSEVDSMLVSSSQIDEALSWVNRGGSLIVGVGAEVTGYDSILQRVELLPQKTEFDIDDVIQETVEELSASEQMREVNRKLQAQRDLESEQDKSLDDTQNSKTNVRDDGENEVLSTDVDAPLSTKGVAGNEFNRELFKLLNVEIDYEFYQVVLNDQAGDAYLAVVDDLTFKHPKIDFDEYQQAIGSSSQLDKFESKGDASLEYQVLVSIGDENGVRLIQFALGDGTFTAISSSNLWTNDYVGLGDHAYFLSYMVPSGSTLYFFYNVEMASLISLLYRFFNEFILLSCLILGLWLWRRGLRVERIQTVAQGQRRNFSEHLLASAKYLVGQKQGSVLLSALQLDIEQKMHAHDASFSRLGVQAQTDLLHRQTQLPREQISQWLRLCNQPLNQDELFASIKISHLIRKRL